MNHNKESSKREDFENVNTALKKQKWNGNYWINKCIRKMHWYFDIITSEFLLKIPQIVLFWLNYDCYSLVIFGCNLDNALE